MKTYINPTATSTELHDEIKDAEEFYDDVYGGCIPDELGERLKRVVTEENLLKRDSYGQTGIAALLKISIKIKQDAKNGRRYAQESAQVLTEILKDINPEIIQKGEEELAKSKNEQQGRSA